MLAAGLLLAAAQARAEGGAARLGLDDEPLEYTRVAAFEQALPQRAGVTRTTQLPLEPGMLMYQSSAEAVANDDHFTARTWLLFLPPHPMAPSLVRLRSFRPGGYVGPESRRLRTLCESTAEGCAKLQAYLQQALAR